MANRIVSFFPDTDLRCGHDGLAAIAKKAKRDVSALEPGQFYAFLNRRQNAVKILTAGDILVYLRQSHRLNFEALTLIPKYFNGTEFNYKAALKQTIEKRLKHAV